jgi:uncharacterized small protein (DUF1192 family)
LEDAIALLRSEFAKVPLAETNDKTERKDAAVGGFSNHLKNFPSICGKFALN